MAGRAILARSDEPALGEAGVFEHREEDLPRHGAGNSVGPLGLVPWHLISDKADVARLKAPARTQDPEDLPQRGGLVRNQVEDSVTERDIE